MDLQPGANTALATTTVKIRVAWSPAVGGLDLDPSAFLLTSSGKVASDADFVFYGQTSGAGGAVTYDAGSTSFTMALERLPGSVEKVALALTIDQGVRRGQRFAQLETVTVTIDDGGAGGHTFKLGTRSMEETALILGECYLRNGQWKFRAVGQGFKGGLGALATHFGVDIADDPDQGMAPPPPVPPAEARPAPAPSPPAAPPPSAGPVNLQKITLEKRQPVSLQKKAGGSFGEIVINLNWTRSSAPQKRGLFGFGGGGSGGIDLDIACMLELQDGFKTVVQALGGNFGSLHQPPYVQLMGDDRTGEVSEGETLRINGAHWGDFRRAVVFAFIYEGAPNWAAANGVITIKVPDQPELVVRMDSHSEREPMCVVALLENDRGNIKVTKLVDYYQGHREVDNAFGFGFRWQAGRK